MQHGRMGITIVSNRPHETVAKGDAGPGRARRGGNALNGPWMRQTGFAGKSISLPGSRYGTAGPQFAPLRTLAAPQPYFRSVRPSRPAILLHSAAVASMIPGPNPLSL